jgi:hypothetical protein
VNAVSSSQRESGADIIIMCLEFNCGIVRQCKGVRGGGGAAEVKIFFVCYQELQKKIC